MRNKCLQKLCACVCFCCLLTWETLKVLLCNTLIQLTRNCSASRSKTRVHTLPPLTQESLHKSMCQDILSSEPKLGMQCSGFPQSFCPSKILVLRSLYCNAKLACGQIQWPETMTCVTLAFQLCGFIGCVFLGQHELGWRDLLRSLKPHPSDGSAAQSRYTWCIWEKSTKLFL